MSAPWALVGRVAVCATGEVCRVAATSDLAAWYATVDRRAIVWVWEGSGEELARLPVAVTSGGWTGRVGGGSLLSLRAKGRAEVRGAASLLPWVEPEQAGADRWDDEESAARLLSTVRDELAELAARGYAVTSTRGPRLTVGAVAWATACGMAGVPPSDPVDWGAYDAGRRAYYGGRCEVGQVRAERVVGWDIASAYPWALLQPVPVGRRSVVAGAQARRAYERGAPGCYYAKVVQPRGEVALLPHRHRPTTGRGRSRGPLLWVTGHVDGWYVGAELAAAEEAGAVVSIGTGHLWDAWAPQWAPYFEHTSADRAELRSAGRDESSAKLLANALSGKLAQGPDATVVRVLGRGERPEQGWHWHGGRVWSRSHRHVPACARPIEAATVTARVRVALMGELLRARGAWMYCDTDSVWLSPQAAAPADDGAPWRQVGVGSEWHAPAPKTYRYRSDLSGDMETRMAGVPVGMRHVLDAFARGESAPPRTHPCMPHLPDDRTLRWVGLRRVDTNDLESRTVPLHRTASGELE